MFTSQSPETRRLALQEPDLMTGRPALRATSGEAGHQPAGGGWAASVCTTHEAEGIAAMDGAVDGAHEP